MTSIAAALLHLPPKGQQTVRYCGVCSNKIRGQVAVKSPSLVTGSSVVPSAASDNQTSTLANHQSEFLLVEPPPMRSARLMRPLWRDLILQVWGGDPLECPCCHGTMKIMRPVLRPEEVEFFLRLHGLWEGIIQLPRPPPPPFDIETMEPIEPPWQAIKEWIADAPLLPCRLQDPPPDLVFHDAPLGCGRSIPGDEPDLDWFNRPRIPNEPEPDWFDQMPTWKAPEIHLDDDRILVLEYT